MLFRPFSHFGEGSEEVVLPKPVPGLHGQGLPVPPEPAQFSLIFRYLAARLEERRRSYQPILHQERRSDWLFTPWVRITLTQWPIIHISFYLTDYGLKRRKIHYRSA